MPWSARCRALSSLDGENLPLDYESVLRKRRHEPQNLEQALNSKAMQALYCLHAYLVKKERRRKHGKR